MGANLGSDATVIPLFGSPLADLIPLILEEFPAPDLEPDEIVTLRAAIEVCGAHLRRPAHRPEWNSALAGLIVAYRGRGSGEFDRALFTIELDPPDSAS
jgi:hypothetical protein